MPLRAWHTGRRAVGIRGRLGDGMWAVKARYGVVYAGNECRWQCRQIVILAPSVACRAVAFRYGAAGASEAFGAHGININTDIPRPVGQFGLYICVSASVTLFSILMLKKCAPMIYNNDRKSVYLWPTDAPARCPSSPCL